MKNFKKFLLCIFVFLISFTMFGCAQIKLNTTYELRQDPNGNQFNVVTAEMNINSIPASVTFQNVQVYVKEYFNQLNNAYLNNLVKLYSNIYDFEALGITAKQDQYEHIINNNLTKYLVIYENDEDKIEFKPDTKTRTIKIKKEFISIYGYIMYFYPDAFEYNAEKNAVVITENYKSMVDIPMGGSFEEEESLFITKSIQSCVPFYYNGKEPAYLETKKQSILDVTAGQTLVDALGKATGITEPELNLIFSFTTPYKRVHSNGVVTKTDKGFTHTWNLSNVDGKISVWRTKANSIAWYVVAAAAGVAVCVVGSVAIGIVKAKRKVQGMKALKKLDDLARGKGEEKK